MRTILSIDLGNSCGWAHSSGHSGTWDLSVRRDESSGMRLMRFEGKLLEVCRTLGVDIIAWEASRQIRHGAAVRVLMELQGVVKSFCHRYTSRGVSVKADSGGIEYIGRSPSEIKKHATGKGNADKTAMLNAARAKWGEQVATEDQADALWLLDLVTKELNGGV